MNKTAHALALAAAALLAIPAAAEGHMCYSKKMPGVIIFTKAPCAPGMEAKESPDYPRGMASQGKPEQARPVSTQERKGTAIASNRPVQDSFDLIRVGMGAPQVRAMVGAPESINASNHGYGASEQWVYRPNGDFRAHYIYIEDGKVRSVQISR